MPSLQKAITALNTYAGSRSGRTGIDDRVRLVVVLVFIGVVLSVPLVDPGRLVWLFVFPIIMAEYSGTGYLRVLLRSLWVLPLIAVIGIFNPIFDDVPLWQIGSVTVSRGWVSFISIVLRGLLSVQALLVLIDGSGFIDICRALRRMKVPSLLVTQLLLLYHYLSVMLDEALRMDRARRSRGFGRRSYPLRLWATLTGQLLIRSVQRAGRIHRAMLARGFDGSIPMSIEKAPLRAADLVFAAGWLAVFAVLRIVDFSALLESALH